MAIESLGLVAWYTLPSFRAFVPFTAIMLDFITACATAFVIDIAAKRSYSSLPGACFVFIGSISRFLRCQSYLQKHDLYFAPSIMFMGFCWRLALLVLLLLPQQLAPRNLLGIASPYLSWHEELAVLCYSTFLGVFRDFPEAEDEPELGLELEPHYLSETFEKSWLKASERSKNPLLMACVKTVSWLLFLGTIPRFAVSALLLAQPLLLKQIILFVGIAAPDQETKWTLILSTFVIFSGSAISRAFHHLLSHRMHAALRGVLFFQTFKKIYRLSSSRAKSSAVADFINADIATICRHIQLHYQFFNEGLHLVLGVVLMWQLAGPACLPSFAAAVISVIIRFFLQSRKGTI